MSSYYNEWSRAIIGRPGMEQYLHDQQPATPASDLMAGSSEILGLCVRKQRAFKVLVWWVDPGDVFPHGRPIGLDPPWAEMECLLPSRPGGIKEGKKATLAANAVRSKTRQH